MEINANNFAKKTSEATQNQITRENLLNDENNSSNSIFDFIGDLVENGTKCEDGCISIADEKDEKQYEITASSSGLDNFVDSVKSFFGKISN